MSGPPPRDATPPDGGVGLWVPMLMEALACGLSRDDDDPAGAVRFMDLRPNYDECGDGKNTPALGYKLKRDLRDDLPARPDLTPKGIHLHWRLPEAFLHIRPRNENTGSDFRAAPNRWAVIRLWRDRGLFAKTWIVESDFVADPDDDASGDAYAAPWLVYKGANAAQPDSPPYHYRPTRIGRACQLNLWTEQLVALKPPLIAFGPANPAFAAFYPSCRNVFGFHDDATDLAEKPLPDKTLCTYLVAGWFSNPGDDPLWKHRNAPATSWNEMQALQWDVPEALRWNNPQAARHTPARTICYAFIGDVEWTAGKPPTTPGERPLHVSLGNGLFEAIAALSAKNGFADQVKSQLQFSALLKRRVFRAELTNDEARRLLFEELGRFAPQRVRLHEGTFTAEPGGLIWEVVRIGESAEKTNDAPESVVNLPASLSEGLVKLNRSQRLLDETDRRLAILRRGLFALWHNYADWTTGPPATRPSPAASNNLIGRIKAQAIVVNDCQGTLKTPTGDVQTYLSQITGYLATEDARKVLGRCDLISRQMPRFWRPNDPFVLLSGMRVPEVQGGAAPLMCRVSAQTFSLADRKGTTGILLARDKLKDSPIAKGLLPQGAVPPDVKELLLDVLFAQGIAAPELAGLLVQDNDPPNVRQRIRTNIDALQTEMLAAARGIRNGTSPDLASLALECAEQDGGPARLSFLSACGTRTSQDGNPFVPVFMVWKALWTKESLAPHLWDLKPLEHDLSWKQAPGRGDSIAADYQGVALVSRNLDRGFKGTGPETAYARFPEYAAVVDGLSGLIGQGLAGLTDAMAMLDRGPQFPPPLSWKGLDNVEIRDTVGAQYSAGPLRTVESSDRYFSPIRGGHLAVTALSLVDTFGRVVPIIDKTQDIRVARTLQIPGDIVKGLIPDLDGLDFIGARLPPRIVQPARLLFRWISADDKQESLADLRTSPVCGWILPSRLDRGLLVCNQRGELAGIIQSIRLSNGKELVHWSALPPHPSAPATEATSTEIPNQHLLHFVNGLLKAMSDDADGSTRFESFRLFLTNLEDRSDQPQQQDLRSAMIGRPLALVRAALRLELDGPPLTSNAKAQLLAPVPDQLDGPATLGVAFPVRLGDRQLGPDGLVGYFFGGADPADYQKMCLSGDQATSPLISDQPYFDKRSYLTLRPNAGPIDLTLLMDPRAGVHIVSGILPANLAVLPPAVVSASSAALRPRFLVAPVLAEWSPTDTNSPSRPGIPLPTNGKDEWGWYAVGADGKAAAKPAALDPAQKSTPFGRSALYEGWLGSMPEEGRTT